MSSNSVQKDLTGAQSSSNSNNNEGFNDNQKAFLDRLHQQLKGFEEVRNRNANAPKTEREIKTCNDKDNGDWKAWGNR
ncbi:hypothetical protein NHQ30_000016 [Ciborinia camelliae]|nr:hypothetical protein NHQ30_000016 [Ciborinia camelliae]